MLRAFESIKLESPIDEEVKSEAIKALEEGSVPYFPNFPFLLEKEEKNLLSPSVLKPNSKNISYDRMTHDLKGHSCTGGDAEKLKEMMKRFADYARKLVITLSPCYEKELSQARTSYRPIEAEGRKTSHLKDDRLLHVDAFPANPVKGNRILRVFSNINPDGRPRVWNVGEPFSDVVIKMAPKVKKPLPGLSTLLKALRLTKDYRTLYDHYMLNIHDAMKNDSEYQRTVPKEAVRFSAGSTWMVYTDQVSHAVISGQYVLEQTFYLPPSSMRREQLSPLRVLEKHMNLKLV